MSDVLLITVQFEYGTRCQSYHPTYQTRMDIGAGCYCMRSHLPCSISWTHADFGCNSSPLTHQELDLPISFQTFPNISEELLLEHLAKASSNWTACSRAGGDDRPWPANHKVPSASFAVPGTVQMSRKTQGTQIFRSDYVGNISGTIIACNCIDQVTTV